MEKWGRRLLVHYLSQALQRLTSIPNLSGDARTEIRTWLSIINIEKNDNIKLILLTNISRWTAVEGKLGIQKFHISPFFQILAQYRYSILIAWELILAKLGSQVLPEPSHKWKFHYNLLHQLAIQWSTNTCFKRMIIGSKKLSTWNPIHEHIVKNQDFWKKFIENIHQG